MNLFSIPPLILAGICFYVFLYHSFIYYFRQRERVHLNFALTCLGISLFDVLCAFLYSTKNIEVGVQIQRAQMITISLTNIAFLWFFIDYISYKQTKIIKIITAYLLFMFVAYLINYQDMNWVYSTPLIKDIKLPFGLQVTYYEMKLGWLSTIHRIVIIFSFLYIFHVLIKLYSSGRRGRVTTMLFGMSIFFIGVINDIMVGHGIYKFIYSIEYFYMAIIVIMAYSLSNEILKLNTIKKALKESYEQFRHLAEATLEAVVIYDGNCIQLANAQFYKMFGYEKDEIYNKSIFEIVDLRYKRYLIEKIKKEGNNHLEAIGINKQGQEVPIEIFLSDINYKGHIAKVLTIRDITSRKEADKEREKLQKQIFLQSKLASIGELAAGIAHEINNPLTIVKGYVDIMKNDTHFSKVKNKKGIEKIDKAINRICSIVQGLKTHIRNGSHSKEVFNINYLIRDTLALIDTIYKNDNIYIHCNCIGKELLVRGNPGQFQQALLNIISNAKDATEAQHRRTIRIESRQTGTEVELKISDNGCGIDQTELDKIFETFYSTKAAGKGLGMGLSITLTIISSMRGKIFVDSKVGEGTTFKIIIPVWIDQGVDLCEQEMISCDCKKPNSTFSEISIN